MRANDWAGLLCATTIILVSLSSAADARYWRHYGYHWYGRSWNGFRPNNDERQVEKQPSGIDPASDSPDQVGDFGAAIEQMIRACDGQVAELKNMPLDAVAGIINSTPDQTNALDHIRSVALEASKSLAHSGQIRAWRFRACHSRPVAFVGSAPGTSRCTPSQGFPHKIPKAVRTRSREIVHSLTLSCLVFQRPPRADAQGILCSRCRD
jgi:hypothetical protein